MKTVRFQAIQFSISTRFSSISPIDRTLTNATTQARVDLGFRAMKEYPAFLKIPALLEFPHQIVSCHIQQTRLEGLTPLQKCSRYILQPKPAGQLIDGFLTGTSPSPSQSGHRSNGNEEVLHISLAQSTGAVEYTDCISAEV